MAVYTQLGAEVLAALIGEYDVGVLVSAKGIAEGVSNSNWLIETTGKHGEGARFILTMYEFRIDIADLPFFLSLLDHLAAGGCAVPRTIHDRSGALYRQLGDKAVALIEFLPGVSLSEPTAAQARAVGAALAEMHLASADFPAARANAMGLAEWQRLVEGCGHDGLMAIDPDLADRVERELPLLAAAWPTDLPQGVIHADLFPDNVLVLGDKVTGLIDFYFACTDLLAYDVAVTHAAWCFGGAGRDFDPAISAALLAGYESVRPLSPEERAALPVLARGAALRFTMSRAWDWLNTPADALVVKKDPMAFARRLEFYADPANAAVFDPA
ncbi:MAG: homoserine kinase [Novosphingobium sp.]|uniref:homoserine kinase n=1 Tax=Novosphingobium sp. TaxID=1874826 RepID=UPI001DD879ED|nr:homoserine kinase [Novosphingobium sp.]MCB2058502.1 homoserine kinase [Novosphingobium sp.]MCP5387633.1 homoserine kinase [Novosphingobium sp.]